jgi:cytochrome P450
VATLGPVTLDDINLSDLAFWERPVAEREAAFRLLREADPYRWFPEPASEILGPGRGYYALVRHHDVVEASRQPELFCSSRGGTNIVDLPPTFVEFFGSMINMDDPRHARLRRIVSPQFTPRRLDELRANVEQTAAAICEEVVEQGECDFVTDVAARLPLRVIVDVMGIPRSEERFIFEQTNLILGFTDPEYVPGQDPVQVMAAPLVGAQRLFEMVQALGEERLRQPRDDLTTALVTAELDGERLTPQELGSFFVLLVVAGNETTRNAIAHGLLALTEHPGERERWRADFEGLAPTAVEEIVRWSTPVIHFRRTVTRDGVRLGDLELSEGDKVVLWYASANRDESVFDDPYRFDLGRQPNDHVGFGGPGPHFCLGAHLARREITVMFRELFRRMPDIEAAGPPARLRSNFINGIKHLPARWTPRRREA